jgi:hypothetical protein
LFATQNRTRVWRSPHDLAQIGCQSDDFWTPQS